MGLIDRLRKKKAELESERYPLEVDEIYYNEDANTHFRVEQLEPNLQILSEYMDQPIFVDADVYKWKYEEGVIREPDDDVTIIEH